MNPLHYFPMYHGATLARFDKDGNRVADAICEGWIISGMEKNYNTETNGFFYEYKLVLRPIADMSPEEAMEVTKPVVRYGDFSQAYTYLNHYGEIVVIWGKTLKEMCVPQQFEYFTPAQIHILVKMRFDLFGLERAGYA